MQKIIKDLLEKKYGPDISEKILSSYLDIEENYRFEKWKYQGLDAGHFVEGIRRILEFELFGNTINFSKQLNNFNSGELQRYENSTSGNDSYKFLIPQALKTIYSIRNKRGIGHIKDVSANKIDATLILFSCKWVLSEIIRLNSDLDIQFCNDLIEEIINRKLDIIWNNGEKVRILNQKVKTEEQILILLYNKNNQSYKNLLDSIEYKNSSRFKTILNNLHKERLIEFNNITGECCISPKGALKIEQVLKNI